MASSEPIAPPVSGPNPMVAVARDQDDPRWISVQPDDLANVHIAVDCGGKRQRLARPNLGAYMWPSLIPDGVPFGYSGDHRDGRPMRIKVLVREDLTDPAVIAELRSRAECAKLKPRYRLPDVERERRRDRRRARASRRAAVAAVPVAA